MADIDPNIILNAGKGVTAFNPVATMTAVQGLQNAQASNQLLQNENTQFQQKQAAGKIVSNALMRHTTPAGGVDYNSVRADLAAQGGDNPFIGESLNQNLGQQGAQTTNDRSAQALDQDKIATLHAHIGALNDALVPLINKTDAQGNPTVTRDDIVKAGANLVSNPSIASDANMAGDVASFISTLPENAGPAVYQNALKGLALRTAGTQAQLEAAYPKPTLVNQGPKLTPVTVNPYAQPGAQVSGPAVTKDGSLPLGVSPEATLSASLARTPVIDPATNRPLSAPTLSLAGKTVQTGFAPGEAETMTANAGRLQAIQAAGLATAPRLASMQNVRAIIDMAPATAFGPTGNVTSTVGKLAAAFGVPAPAIVNGQTSIDELNKSLSLIAAQQGQAMGAGTDASRALVHDSNPSMSNSREGLKANLAVVQGNDEWLSARNQAAQQWAQKHPASDIAGFETGWNKNVSPLVFQSQHMTPQAQKQLFNSMSGVQNKDGSYSGQKGAFLRALDFAGSQGWIGN